MYENIRVIAADIDGTLSMPKDDPSAYTIQTIEKIRSKGVLFGLASGRPIEDIISKYSSWNMSSQFDFLIGFNGCELYDDKTKMIHQYNKLKKEWIKEIIELMAEFNPNINMYLPGRFLSARESDKARLSAYKTKREFVLVEDIADFYQQDNSGIMFRYDPRDDERIHEKLRSIRYKDYIAFNTQSDLLEFSHRDSNKGYALKQYATLYDIDLNDIMAFGDTDNDNEMLRICNGICLLNGTASTKVIAKDITRKVCVEDGLADYLERNLL